MKVSADEHRRDFAIWIRTGFWPDPANDRQVERKYNPWHDPENGQFTFAGTGRHHGASGQGLSAKPAPKPRPPLAVDVPGRPARRTRNSGGGGGDFVGGGASGSWDRPAPISAPVAKRPAKLTSKPALPSRNPSVRTATPGSIAAGNTMWRRKPSWRKVVRNGYEFEIDEADRPRNINAVLEIGTQSRRSRTAQRQAGGPDRLPTDDGGHYIAVRFNGPSDAFNHLAQNARVNRGEYRVLEDRWAKALKNGERVTINIQPVYKGSSRRPFRLDVKYKIGDRSYFKAVPNPGG